jgi:hypothetical protein
MTDTKSPIETDEPTLARDRDRELLSEEYVPEDDTVIGKAMRQSLAVILGVGVVVTLVLFLSREAPVEEIVVAKDAGKIEQLDQGVDSVPSVRFTDITESAGVTFIHNSGAEGDKLLPECMGSGVAILDYDGDGDQDILFVNGADWPESEKSRPAPAMALYANDGLGSFRDVTSEAGLEIAFYGTGVAAADYDNDGDTDLFVAALGRNRLFRNDGGRFEEVSEVAGVGGGETTWSTSVAFFDFDNDGDLDLFVCNYVQWSRAIDFELNFTLNGRDRAYGPPTHYQGAHPQLLRNEGDGTFADISEEAGVRVANEATGVPVAKSLGVIPIDFDRDGWMDLVVANDTVQNFLFRNTGEGAFEELGAIAGVAYDGAGRSTGAMGIDAGYYRNSEALAIGIGNFANEMTSLYVTQSDPMFFSDESIVEGVGSPSRLYLSFGFFFFDYDLDRRLDILQINGHLEDEINQIQPSQHYLQAPQMFWNAGPESRSCFIAVPPEELGDLGRPIVGRGSAYGDLDGDGDLDVVITQTGRSAVILRNDQALGRHWIRVKLTGVKCNRDAIGARVSVMAGGETQMRMLAPSRSYLSQSEAPLTFGLGEADRVEKLVVYWPDGSSKTFENLEVDRLHALTQSQ